MTLNLSSLKEEHTDFTGFCWCLFRPTGGSDRRGASWQQLYQGLAGSRPSRICNLRVIETLATTIWLWLSKPMGSHFGVSEFTRFRLDFSADWDVRGYGLGILTHSHMSPCANT